MLWGEINITIYTYISINTMLISIITFHWKLRLCTIVVCVTKTEGRDSRYRRGHKYCINLDGKWQVNAVKYLMYRYLSAVVIKRRVGVLFLTSMTEFKTSIIV